MMNEIKKLERLNYFSGHFLSANDFTDEQNYFVEKEWRHNRFLHGWGVVSGLSVEVHDSVTVYVTPGYAIDCCGNGILIDAPVEIPVPKEAGTFYVIVQYIETKVKPVPVSSDAGAGEQAEEFTRIREDYRIDIIEVDPNSGHEGVGPGTAGCGLQHPFAIARLIKRDKRWKIILMGRR